MNRALARGAVAGLRAALAVPVVAADPGFVRSAVAGLMARPDLPPRRGPGRETLSGIVGSPQSAFLRLVVLR